MCNSEAFLKYCTRTSAVSLVDLAGKLFVITIRSCHSLTICVVIGCSYSVPVSKMSTSRATMAIEIGTCWLKLPLIRHLFACDVNHV